MLGWADQLIQEYKDRWQQLRRRGDQLDRGNPLYMQYLKQFNSMD